MGASQLENSNAFGSGTLGTTFYGSLVAFGVSLAASTVLLLRMLTLINRASHGLAAAASNAEAAMETFVDMRSWGILRHGDVGCLTHIAARRGMVEALDFLVSNGANPTAVDSTGQTPLEIAEGAEMEEARNYLKMIIASRGTGGSFMSPAASERNVHQTRPPRSPGGAKNVHDEIEEKQEEINDQTPVYTWILIRKVAESAVRWVNRGVRATGKASRKVGVEPLVDTTSSLDESPSPPPALLPAPLVISYAGQVDTIADELSHEAIFGSSFPLPQRDNQEQGNDGKNDLTGWVSSAARPLSGYVCEGGEDETAEPVRHRCQAPDATPDETLVLRQNVLREDSKYKNRNNHPRLDDVCLDRQDSSDLQLEGRESGVITSKAENQGEQQDTGTTAADDGPLRRLGSDAGSTVDGSVKDDQGIRAAATAAVAATAATTTTVSAVSSIFGTNKEADLADSAANRVSQPTAKIRRPSGARNMSATFPVAKMPFSPTSREGAAGRDNGKKGSAAGAKESSRGIRRLSVTVLRRLSTPGTSSPGYGRHGLLGSMASGDTIYSPTQSVLNITWALRRLRPLSTPRERRVAFRDLRESSPFHIPAMYLLSFVVMASLGEIPRRTGDHYLGHASKRPVTCCDMMARAIELGEDPIVVYVSHRWLEPDFKNPDDHSKARFYQVINVCATEAREELLLLGPVVFGMGRLFYVHDKQMCALKVERGLDTTYESREEAVAVVCRGLAGGGGRGGASALTL